MYTPWVVERFNDETCMASPFSQWVNFDLKTVNVCKEYEQWFSI